MVIEFARHVFNSKEPNSTEFSESTSYPVIDLLPEQKNVKDKGATMRLGNYPCKLVDSSRAARAYDQPLIQERHRHRFEFNNEYREQLQKAGMTYSGVSPDDKLVEICELTDHPWMSAASSIPSFYRGPADRIPYFAILSAWLKIHCAKETNHLYPSPGNSRR